MSNNESITAKDIYTIYSLLNRIMINKDYEKINNLLKAIDTDNTNYIIISSVLRITSPVRELIFEWGKLRDRCVASIKEKNEKPEIWLRGLIEG